MYEHVSKVLNEDWKIFKENINTKEEKRFFFSHFYPRFYFKQSLDKRFVTGIDFSYFHLWRKSFFFFIINFLLFLFYIKSDFIFYTFCNWINFFFVLLDDEIVSFRVKVN